MFVRLLFGLYNDMLFKSKLLRIISSLHCFAYLTLSVTVAAYEISSGVNRTTLNFTCVWLSEFVANMIISFFTKEKSFAKFYSRIQNIDKTIGFNKSDFNIIGSTSFYYIFVFARNLTEFLCYCCEYRFFTLWHILIMLNLSTNVLSHVTRTVLFEILWSRIRHMVSRLKINCLVYKYTTRQKEVILQKFVFSYKHLMCLVECASKSFKLLVSYFFFSAIIIIIFINYNMVICICMYISDVLSPHIWMY